MLCLYQLEGPTVPVSPRPGSSIPGGRADMEDLDTETVKINPSLEW